MTRPCPYCGAVSPLLCLSEAEHNRRLIGEMERERFADDLRYRGPGESYPRRWTVNGLYEVRSLDAWDAVTAGREHPEARRLTPVRS